MLLDYMWLGFFADGTSTLMVKKSILLKHAVYTEPLMIMMMVGTHDL